MANATDLKLILKPTLAIAFAPRAAGTYVSTGIDVASFESVYLHFFSALNSGATGTLRLQTSATLGSGYVNVSDVALSLSDAFDGLPNAFMKARTGPMLQYVRLSLTISTGTPSCGAFLYLYDPLNGADQNTAYLN